MYDDDDGAIILAGRARGMRVKRGAGDAARRAQMAARLPSASGRLLRQFLGFPVFSFTATSGTSIRQITRPQRSIALDRIIADVARSGTTATGLVTVTQFKIGAEDMLAGNDALPIGMFAANVTSGKFAGYTAKGGIDVSMTLNITAAPTTTDRVDVSVGGFGDAVAG